MAWSACSPCIAADRDAFAADHLRIMLAVSSKIALSVENALKYQQAEDSATTDYLTGLPNARSLFVHLSRELARCRRTGTSLAVMVCDLDNFKQINDLYGHLEGDNLLKDFARPPEGNLPRLTIMSPAWAGMNSSWSLPA
jgi:GGDEF domain-containing protein